MLALPLSVVGSMVGHSVGYLLAVPDAGQRAHVLEESGHSYLAHAPLLAAICFGPA
jgi:hypothetical protein